MLNDAPVLPFAWPLVGPWSAPGRPLLPLSPPGGLRPFLAPTFVDSELAGRIFFQGQRSQGIGSHWIVGWVGGGGRGRQGGLREGVGGATRALAPPPGSKPEPTPLTTLSPARAATPCVTLVFRPAHLHMFGAPRHLSVISFPNSCRKTISSPAPPPIGLEASFA